MKTTNGQQYNSKKVIVSVPITLYPLIDFKPELPPAKKELAKSKLGYYAKTVLISDSPLVAQCKPLRPYCFYSRHCCY